MKFWTWGHVGPCAEVATSRLHVGPCGAMCCRRPHVLAALLLSICCHWAWLCAACQLTWQAQGPRLPASSEAQSSAQGGWHAASHTRLWRWLQQAQPHASNHRIACNTNQATSPAWCNVCVTLKPPCAMPHPLCAELAVTTSVAVTQMSAAIYFVRPIVWWVFGTRSQASHQCLCIPSPSNFSLRFITISIESHFAIHYYQHRVTLCDSL